MRRRGAARAQLANHLHGRGRRIRGDRGSPGLEIPDRGRHPGREQEEPREGPRRQDASLLAARCSTTALADKNFVETKLPKDAVPPNQIYPGFRLDPARDLQGPGRRGRHLPGHADPLRSVRAGVAAREHRRRRHPEGEAGDHDQPRPDARGRRLRDPGRPGQPPSQLPGHRGGRERDAAQGDGIPAARAQGDRSRLVHRPAAEPVQRLVEQRRHHHDDAAKSAVKSDHPSGHAAPGRADRARNDARNGLAEPQPA